ncbi:MAG: ATP-dependent Clp protease ATP-binding subunit ClpC [Candidatus Paceibacteria bacterium]|jgi:ATP-dependent Clp protease ATP-binding subunit ClpC
MIFLELQNKTKGVYPAIVLEKAISYNIRKSIRKILFIVSIVLLFVILLSVYGLKIPLIPAGIAVTFANFKLFFRSIFLMTFSLWMTLQLLEAMYTSYYFKENNIEFEVLKTVLGTKPDDITGGFLRSYVGRRVMKRLGVPLPDVDRFLTERISTVTSEEYEMVRDSDEEYISFADYGRSLIHFDDQFKHFLTLHKVTPDDFRGALQFVTNTEEEKRNQKRWWIKEKLIKVPSLGRNWSFGKTFFLERYGHSIMSDSNYINLGLSFRIYKKYIEQMEQIFLKRHGANVILISETNDSGMAVIAAFSRAIFSGEVRHELEHHRVFVLDISLLMGVASRERFEDVTSKIFNQASKAGNVVLVIPNMSGFVDSANSLGIDAPSFFSKIMGSSNVNVVAVSSSSGYHSSLETHVDLMTHFDKLVIDEFGSESVFRMIQNEIVRIEKQTNIFFTYQSVREIVDSSNRYFPERPLVDTAIDILEEVAINVISNGKKVVTSEDIHDLVEKKTGVPLGELSEIEKEVFTNLEDTLHESVIGQDNAITAISSAIRRSRSGIVSADRPIGTFLFLGPTGVGKTETAKALAHAFFKGDNKSIVRFDMSEYSTPDSVQKLIGTTGETGTLARAISDKKYGILLLDEFEKATPDVLDLFLRILDEGIFTDSRGEKIDARNMIIIATSNAASKMIFEVNYNGEDLSKKKDEIIRNLIKEGVFKPELLNRFDDVTLFHTLTDSDLSKVAKKMMNELNDRVKEKGIKIIVDDELINYLVKIGGNYNFGGRAIKRAIQDHIEALIAEALISEELKAGMEIRFEAEGEKLQLVIV